MLAAARYNALERERQTDWIRQDDVGEPKPVWDVARLCAWGGGRRCAPWLSSPVGGAAGAKSGSSA
jgi:hypothetical protein